MSHLSDMHIHIDYFENYKQIYDSFEENKMYALFVTNLPEIYHKCLNDFSVNNYVKLGIGYNPQLNEKYPFNKKLFDSMLLTTKYVGEVGLDYSKEFVHTKKSQNNAFDYICYQSARQNKIMSIHSRKAENDVLEMLVRHEVEHAIFHWYSGDLEDARKIAEQGYYFSVNYSMLHSKKGFEVIKSLPIDRLLIETDAPFGKSKLKGVTYNLPEIYNQFSKRLNIDSFNDVVYENLSSLLFKQRDS
ncbi:TatD family deoxyribonuclease [Bacillus pumilus]|uniref:TatD family hydrolase n=1 Tax=Bacillus TaxID=1386 RepID=UPI000760FF11|nr:MULTISPECIES: TatD family hydrolase [Bacillus]AZV54497.1 TatD family deoxyribonuclease [Bacillus pumilus]PAC81148.1 TatD family deoxyribonuclease [Bacillus sp. 7788]